MQAICSIAATILILAAPGERRTPADGVMPQAGMATAHYAGKGLPGLPRLPSLPRLPRVPKPR